MTHHKTDLRSAMIEDDTGIAAEGVERDPTPAQDRAQSEGEKIAAGLTSVYEQASDSAAWSSMIAYTKAAIDAALIALDQENARLKARVAERTTTKLQHARIDLQHQLDAELSSKKAAATALRAEFAAIGVPVPWVSTWPSFEYGHQSEHRIVTALNRGIGHFHSNDGDVAALIVGRFLHNGTGTALPTADAVGEKEVAASIARKSFERALKAIDSPAPQVTAEMEEAGRAWARSHDPSTFADIFVAMWNARAARAAPLGRDELRTLWREFGGGWHGPYVETYTIPESQFFDFISAVVSKSARPALASEVDVMGLVQKFKEAVGAGWYESERGTTEEQEQADIEEEEAYAALAAAIAELQRGRG